MSPALSPKVTGRLKETEATIIRLLRDEGQNAIYRTSVSIDAVIALAAVRAAHKERRDSLSNLFASAVAEYTEKHGAQIASEEAALLLQAKRLGLNPAEILRTALSEARQPAEPTPA